MRYCAVAKSLDDHPRHPCGQVPWEDFVCLVCWFLLAFRMVISRSWILPNPLLAQRHRPDNTCRTVSRTPRHAHKPVYDAGIGTWKSYVFHD